MQHLSCTKHCNQCAKQLKKTPLFMQTNVMWYAWVSLKLKFTSMINNHPVGSYMLGTRLGIETQKGVYYLPKAHYPNIQIEC